MTDDETRASDARLHNAADALETALVACRAVMNDDLERAGFTGLGSAGYWDMVSEMVAHTWLLRSEAGEMQ